ncbi:MAG: ABC transporter permease [Candidatus Nanohaloarchaea archaeon]
MKQLRKHLRVYAHYFLQFWKSRLVYKTDFALNSLSQMLNLGTSLLFLTLIFTQVETIRGWTFNQMLFLAGVGGVAMNVHHIFLFNVYNLGDEYVLTGDLDRYKLRPLNVLFQVYADQVRDESLPKLITNLALIAYAGSRIEAGILSAENVLYAVPALFSAVLVFGAVYLFFASLSFWTGRSKPIIWLVFRVSDFRRYPYSIYSKSIKILLVTLMPLAFASFFPATFFLGKPGWDLWQLASLAAGPFFYSLAYGFWRFGLSRYSSTGS